MANGRSGAAVKKSVRLDPKLVSTISAWAGGEGVGFSEAVRRLCSQGLATWPGSPFAAPAGSAQEVMAAVERAKAEAVDEIRNAIDEAAGDIIYATGKDAR